jgi:hypothetical protein
MFKNKRRSAHGFFSSPQVPAISAPTNFVKISGMGSLGERPATANSVMTEPVLDRQNGIDDGGATGEPLVQDFEQLDSDFDADLQESPTPRTPTLRNEAFLPLASHPVGSPSEDIAPPPPDFTRRGIHIPTRTRYAACADGCRYLRKQFA